MVRGYFLPKSAFPQLHIYDYHTDIFTQLNRLDVSDSEFLSIAWRFSAHSAVWIP